MEPHPSRFGRPQHMSIDALAGTAYMLLLSNRRTHKLTMRQHREKTRAMAALHKVCGLAKSASRGLVGLREHSFGMLVLVLSCACSSVGNDATSNPTKQQDEADPRTPGEPAVECPPLGTECPEGCTAVGSAPIRFEGEESCLEPPAVLGCYVPPPLLTHSLNCVVSPDGKHGYMLAGDPAGHLVLHGYRDCDPQESETVHAVVEANRSCSLED